MKQKFKPGDLVYYGTKSQYYYRKRKYSILKNHFLIGIITKVIKHIYPKHWFIDGKERKSFEYTVKWLNYDNVELCAKLARPWSEKETTFNSSSDKFNKFPKSKNPLTF